MVATLPKILIVEDNANNREMLSRRLQKHGYDVRWAAEGRSGIALATSWLPDLILMDIALGRDIDGWEATSLLKSQPATRCIPIIALTAHALATDRERSMLAGCVDHEIKPVDFKRLLTKIERLTKDNCAPVQPLAAGPARRISASDPERKREGS